jgi:hypothetical protein
MNPNLHFLAYYYKKLIWVNDYLNYHRRGGTILVIFRIEHIVTKRLTAQYTIKRFFDIISFAGKWV